MKKTIFFLACLFCVTLALSQDPNPDLFQTWYLVSVRASDAKDLYVVSEINPPITPTLIIEENLTFSGQGACNDFTGVYEFDPQSGPLNVIAFSASDDLCETMVHDLFENNYFGFMEQVNSHFYFIQDEGQGQKLTLQNQIFGEAIFSNLQLTTPDFQKQEIILSPNPVSNNLSVSTGFEKIQQIIIYNLSGLKVLRVSHNFDTINVASIPEGMYLLKIYTPKGIITEKFIKI